MRSGQGFVLRGFISDLKEKSRPIHTFFYKTRFLVKYVLEKKISSSDPLQASENA